MFTPRAVARTMIELAAARGISVTNLTLQKLIYFAHGYMLAVYGRPLVNEQFQAWKYGPVLESLYHDLKIFGTSRIGPHDGFIGTWQDIPADAVEERGAISAVLTQLGHMSGGQLIDFSHDAQGPWHAAFQANAKNISIDNAAISPYFRTIVK